jgi:Flp pilus assembly protein TadB
MSPRAACPLKFLNGSNRLSRGLGGSKKMPVRVSPVSKFASLLIIAVGVFTLFVGVVGGVLPYDVAGVAFVALGVILYRLLFRFSRKLEGRIKEAQKG